MAKFAGFFINILMSLGYTTGLQILNLPEGSNCTDQGLNGRCVPIHRCLSSVEDIKMRNYPAICSFKSSETIICCTDCELVDDTRNLVNTTLGIFYKNGQKARDHCLVYLRDFSYECKMHVVAGLTKEFVKDLKCYKYLEYVVGVAGGRDARRKEFLNMALLGYGRSVQAAQWLCGGSVISERFILTAGHCLAAPSIGRVKYIGLGILKRSDPEEMWQRYRVLMAIPHPLYRPPSKYHDIALLKTTTRIIFNEFVLPACLHYETNEYDGEAEATGWGATVHRGGPADTLQTVQLKEFEEEDCAAHYPRHRQLMYGYDHRTQMCYGDQDLPRDTCEGDSGGPLQNMRHTVAYCVQTIIGVTSYGKACGFAGNSGMYTRVLAYLPWIESVVWP